MDSVINRSDNEGNEPPMTEEQLIAQAIAASEEQYKKEQADRLAQS